MRRLIMDGDAFIRKLADRTGIGTYYARLLFERLRADDELMSELMGCCARPGPADNDSDLEFTVEPCEPHVPDMWLLGGSGLPATHHLPEPADPRNVGRDRT